MGAARLGHPRVRSGDAKSGLDPEEVRSGLGPEEVRVRVEFR